MKKSKKVTIPVTLEEIKDYIKRCVSQCQENAMDDLSCEYDQLDPPYDYGAAIQAYEDVLEFIITNGFKNL